MNRRTLSLIAIATLAVPVVVGFSASQLQAQGGGRPGMEGGHGLGAGHRGDHAEHLIETLDLSEAQVAQIRAIREGDRDTMQALHANLRTERETMHDLMSGTASEAELRAQHAEIQTLHREVADLRFENMLAVRNVLTPEQRTDLSERMEQRREDHQGRFQERRESRRQHRLAE
ncbi:Spy/CpxP family protein refolding chaperone [Halomicronema sp. CCY15110]|uniref:Spy/CpxP family protein refolding chaperone n=1 Tax=Halomicronema sp. CCY15110 TaxID=2767773 RepID=UPI0019524163|nr:Spy/CpxP family protein refolding chaperone [Halomicronema sp. CCY15110]